MGIKKVVLVTGSSQGIGEAISEQFGAAGWQVALNGRTESDKLHAVKEKLSKKNIPVMVVPGDVGNAANVEHMVKSVIERWGRIDSLICNAGSIHEGFIGKVSDREWDHVTATNLKGVFLCTKAVSKHMITMRAGSIVIIGSIQGVRGGYATAAYAASKGGVAAFTRSVARELGKRCITVNTVLPGYQVTGMENKQYEESAKKESTLNTTTDINELSRFVVFLAGIRSVSGQVFNWDSRII